MRGQHGNMRASKTFLFLCLGSLLWGLLWLVLLRAEAAAAAQPPPAPQQNGTATAAALLEMKQQIFATQTAAAMTLQPAIPTSAPTITPRPTSTLRPTSTHAALPTPSATPSATPTTAPSATATVPPTTVSPPTRAPEAAPAAEVLVAGLNLRSGPGTGYAILGNAALGQRLPVLGQWGDCAWLRVQLADGRAAWTSGGAAYTRLNVPCSRLAAVAAPTVPAPTVVAPTAAPQPPSAASAPPTPTPERQAEEPPLSAPAPAAVSSGPTTISPSSPPSGVALNEADAATFVWSYDAPLGPGQVFEVVFWHPSESPNTGRALNEASPNSSVTLAVGRYLSPGAYKWGVFLAQLDPFQRIRFLGEGGAITVAGGDAGSDDAGSGSPAEPGGKDGKGG